MSEKERKIGEVISSAMEVLPEDKVDYFMGFAEGVAAMASQVKAGMADA